MMQMNTIEWEQEIQMDQREIKDGAECESNSGA